MSYHRINHPKSKSHHLSFKSLDYAIDLPTIRTEIKPPTTHRKLRSTNPGIDLFKEELRKYEEKKSVIQSGQLTMRAMRQVLKPNRLRWDKKQIKFTDDQPLHTAKLKVADFVLNQKGSVKNKTLALAQFQLQLDSPKTLPSTHSEKLIGFVGRIKQHQRTRGKNDTYINRVQSQIKIEEQYFKSPKMFYDIQ